MMIRRKGARMGKQPIVGVRVTEKEGETRRKSGVGLRQCDVSDEEEYCDEC